MTKKKFFASLGVMTALVGTAVFGAMLCMGNASADAAALKDEVELASAAVPLASSSTDWQNGAVVGGAMWKLVTGEYDYQLANCPECGVENGYGGYTSIIFDSAGGCTYSYTHLGVRGQNVHSGTIQIHDGEEFTVSSTCTIEGYIGLRCKDCGAEVVMQTIPVIDHDFGEGVSVPATSMFCSDTKYTCTICKSYSIWGSTGTTSRTAHTTKVISESPATCVSNGSKILTCTVCQTTWDEEIPKIDHSYGEGIVTKPATCEEDGVLTFACQVCGGAQYTERIPLLGHEIVDIPAVDPTCTEAGHTAGSKCARCDKDIVAPVERAALGHAWGVWDDNRGSCDEVGTRSRMCSRCNEVEIEEIAAGTHSWDLGTIIEQPTCTESGVKEFTCVVCGDTQTEIVEATGHKGVSIAAVSPTCTQPGLTAGSECTLCGIVLEKQKVVPAKGHDLVHEEAVEPTTTSEGNIEYWHCKECGLYFSDDAGSHEIALEDTILDRLPDDGGEKPNDAEDEGGMSGWQIALAVVAGVILLAAVGLLIDKFVINKDGNSVYDRAVNKVKSKSNKR